MAELRKGYWVHLLPVERPSGALAIALIARRTYSIAADSAVLVPLPDEEQPPILEQDRCDEGKPEKAPPTVESELVPEKLKVDVIVLGKAYAPGGKPLASFECAVQVGERRERLRIWGPRKALWQPPKKENQKLVSQLPKFSEPEPIKDLNLSYLHAYGGKSWFIQDDGELKRAGQIQEVIDAENAEKKAATQKKKDDKKKAEDKQKKEAEVAALLAGKTESAKAEKLKYGDGSEGFDEEGVRLWNAAASNDGTAVLSLEELDKAELAEMAAKMRRDAEEQVEREREAAKQKLRKNADGEWIEVDDGAELLSDADWEKAKTEAGVQAEKDALALAEASRKRTKETVQSSDGTQVLDMEAMPDGDPDTWPDELKAKLAAQDEAGKSAREKAEIERQKAIEAALAQYPQVMCPTNPYGKGFCLANQRALLQRLELPQIEHPDAPLTPNDLIRDVVRLDEVPFAYGFGTFPRHARPRVQQFGPPLSAMAGIKKAMAEYQRGLDLEDDEQVRILQAMGNQAPTEPLKVGFYNAAPVNMQWPTLRGDEPVTLTNLTKNGTLWFKLPGKVLIGELDRGNGVERQDLKLDTLVIDVEQKQATLVWRTQFALKNWEELSTYPHMVGWVLDLDVEQKRDMEWADRLKAAQGEGTAVLDLNAMPLESEPYLVPQEQSVELGVLELPKEGSYLRAETDEQWIKDAAAGVHDLDAEEAERRAEAAYQAKKAKALAGLTKADKEEAERRQEVADALAAGTPVPLKGQAQAKGGKPKK